MTERAPSRAMTAALMVLLAGPATAETARDKRQELIEVQKQLEAKKKEIEEYRRQENDLRKDVSKLATETSESKRKLTALEDKIREAERKKGDIKGKLGALQFAEGQWRGVLAGEIREYHRGRLAEFDLYGRGQLWEESVRRAAILEQVDYLDKLRGSRRKTEAAAAEARRLSSRLQVRSKDARLEHQSRESLFRQKVEVYRETRSKMEETQRTIRELQDSALALTRLVRALEKKSAYKASVGPVPLAEPRHSLPWPAEGRVVVSFGKQKIAELNTWVIHQGIRLETPPDAPVHPVKDGKVIFSGPFRSYGQVMIVDHGQAFFTIYGQLGRLDRKKGDAVRAAEAIAVAGPSGGGGTVYFEMRQSGDALDPIEWLKDR